MFNCWSEGPFSQDVLPGRQKTCFYFVLCDIALRATLMLNRVNAVQFKSGVRVRLIFRAQKAILFAKLFDSVLNIYILLCFTV